MTTHVITQYRISREYYCAAEFAIRGQSSINVNTKKGDLILSAELGDDEIWLNVLSQFKQEHWEQKRILITRPFVGFDGTCVRFLNSIQISQPRGLVHVFEIMPPYSTLDIQ